jgi:hypothetical protein
VRRLIFACAVAVLAVAPAGAEEKKAEEKKTKESPLIAAARKKLDTPVTVDYKETRLEEIAEDLKKQVENLSIKIDNSGGVSNNLTMTYKASDKPLSEVLDEMFKKNDLGYVIGEKKGDTKYRYRGWLIIKKGKFRGELEDEASADARPAKPEKPDKPEKPAAKEKPEPDKPETPPEDPEKEAARKLKLAKILDNDGLKDKAKKRYEEIVKKYPKTKAAKEAKELLEKLDQ